MRSIENEKRYTNGNAIARKQRNKIGLVKCVAGAARRMLQSPIESELADYITVYADKRDKDVHRGAVRNGHLPERELVSGIGSPTIRCNHSVCCPANYLHAAILIMGASRSHPHIVLVRSLSLLP
jgi:hypothetical protein